MLAIHILTIVANSAGCERAFSHMGRIHAATCSRLGVEKVRKTTIIGMDITRSHLEAGLLRRCHLDAFPANNEREAEVGAEAEDLDAAGSNLDIGNLDLEPGVAADPLDFEKLAARLVADAGADNDSDSELESDDEEPPPTPLPNPATSSGGIQTRRAASRTTLPVPVAAAAAPAPTLPPQTSRQTRSRKTQIPLKILFIYPTDVNASLNGLDDFWKGGIKNLENESAVLEILSGNGEDSNGGLRADSDTQMASADGL
jgi:hypothetical protein